MSQPAFDLDFDDAGDPTFSVAELTDEINGTLKRRFFEGVWVRGEIQGWNERNGHAYFNLTEETENGRATMSVSFFANARMRLRPMLGKHRLRLGDGIKVRIHGYLDVYGPTGRLSLKMSGIDPRYTLGEMALARDEVIRTLTAEGLFDRNRATRLSPVPLRLGIVSSIGTAAWHDFTDELSRSGLGFLLRVIDVRVQGEAAVPMVTAAIRTLAGHDDVDAIVLIRGGGSRTDLAAFDAESIARAIATSRIPVLTGLGHEIDRSIADDVAYLALKTPTACAGALIERVLAYQQRSEELWAAIALTGWQRLERTGERLDELQHRIAARTRSATALADQRLTQHAARIPVAARQILTVQQGRVERAVGRVGADARRQLDMAGLRLDLVAGRAAALDPVATMARGWTITRTNDGRLVRSPDDVVVGDELVTTTASGDVHSRVESSSST
jgi:exodeoxyribonuclease VII large subunit